MNLTKDLTFEIFECGVDYGQLLAEEERESESTFDAFLCYSSAKKYNTPAPQTRTRQVHSEKWFTEKRKAKKRFFEIIKLCK